MSFKISFEITIIFSNVVLQIIAMSKIGANIRVLRDLKKISQESLSIELDITRARLGSYEEGRSEPPYDLLMKIADYFTISIDALIRGDLSKTSPDTLMKIGKNRILFPMKVDNENNDVIEVVPIKAVAGYTTGFGDPEYIEKLPVMYLPFKVTGKHRAFPIIGDSMPPLKDKTIVVGKYVESVNDITDGQTYVVLTKNKELVYKRLYRKDPKKNDVFIFSSDNKEYTPYELYTNSLLEVWSYVCSINIGPYSQEELNIEAMIKFLQSQRVEIAKEHTAVRF
jgi:transcriptional regulator with XRE-family HTH domain/effector-binding domain-containing protein